MDPNTLKDGSELARNAATIAAAIVAFVAAISARRTFRFQVIKGLLDAYSTPEMATSMKKLWDFYRDCLRRGENLQDAFERTYREERDTPYMKDPFDAHRRRVAYFYSQAEAHTRNLREEFYQSWTSEDLEIIPRILIPMNVRLWEILEGETPLPPIRERHDLSPSLKRLMQLYRGARGGSMRDRFEREG